MPKKNKAGGGGGARQKSRGAPLVLAATERVAPANLPINPSAGAAGRYKMPQLVCITTGKGKSTRTRLDNLAAVAAALERPSSYILLHCSYALSVQADLKDSSLRAEPSRLE